MGAQSSERSDTTANVIERSMGVIENGERKVDALTKSIREANKELVDCKDSNRRQTLLRSILDTMRGRCGLVNQCESELDALEREYQDQRENDQNEIEREKDEEKKLEKAFARMEMDDKHIPLVVKRHDMLSKWIVSGYAEMDLCNDKDTKEELRSFIIDMIKKRSRAVSNM